MTIIERFALFSDYEVLTRVLSGETGLYEVIMRRYNPYLFKVGRSYGFNQFDTEDLIQETYINAYQNLDKFENRSSLKTWLVKIMLNQCYQKKKKSSFQNEILSDDFEKNTNTPMFSQKAASPARTIMNNE